MCSDYHQLGISSPTVEDCAHLVAGDLDMGSESLCSGGDGYFSWGIIDRYQQECSCCTRGSKATSDVSEHWAFNVYHVDKVSRTWTVDDIHYEVNRCTQ